MRIVTRILALFLLILGLSVPLGASAGTAIDPNVGDYVVGITGGVRYALESKAFDGGNGYGNTEVGCGTADWHLLGGGAKAGGPLAQSWQTAARPIDFDGDMLGDDGWYASGHGVAPAVFTGYSTCIRDVALRYRMTTVPDSTSSQRSGSVGCGSPAWQVTTGGVFIATSGSWVNSTVPMDGGDPTATPDDGWAGSVHDSNGGGGGFYVHAVCAKGVTLRYVKLPPKKVLTGAEVVRKVACRPAEHVVGGGARVTGSANRARLVSTFPYDGKDPDGMPDDGWQSRVYGISGAQKQVTAFAICLG